jgi:hypothetical protein
MNEVPMYAWRFRANFNSNHKPGSISGPGFGRAKRGGGVGGWRGRVQGLGEGGVTVMRGPRVLRALQGSRALSLPSPAGAPPICQP